MLRTIWVSAWCIQAGCALLVAQDATGQPADQSTAATTTALAQPIQLEHCLVSLIHTVELSTPIAGTIDDLHIQSGSVVVAGQPLARLDNRSAVMRQRMAEARLREAGLATSDVDVRDARTAARLARLALSAAGKAETQTRGAIAGNEMRRLENDAQRTTLAIERSERDLALTRQTLEVRTTELDAAHLELELHTLLASMNGHVVDVYKHSGEWLAVGEPLLRIVRLDRLRIEAFVDPAELGPHEIAGRHVRVTAVLERGRIEEFPGEITFVRSIIDTNGQYRIQAEVANRQVDGHWLLRPGLLVSMTLHDGVLPLAEPLTRSVTQQPGAQPHREYPQIEFTTGRSLNAVRPPVAVPHWTHWRQIHRSQNGIWRPERLGN